MNPSETVLNHRVFRQALTQMAPAVIGLESAQSGLAGLWSQLDCAGQRPDEAVDELREAFARLAAEENDPGVLTTVQDPLASVLQSAMLEGLTPEQAGPAATDGFEVKFDSRDIFGWVGGVFTWWRSLRPHDWVTPPPAPAATGPELRVAVLSDWGTNLYSAPVCAGTIEVDPRPFGLLLHLGECLLLRHEQGSPNPFPEALVQETRADAGGRHDG